MSIKEIMELGTSGMNTAQKQEEKERRIKVVERVNLMAGEIKRIDDQLDRLTNGCKACLSLRYRKARYNRELKRIKADESVWLKQAAWFMYC